MKNKTIPFEYANDLIYELEKAFWDERGRGARFRMTKIGQEFYLANCRPLLQSAEIDHILAVIQKVLQDQGLLSSVTYNLEERLLKVSFKGCIHRQVEDKMLEKGIEPFTCIPANLIVLAIEEKLDRPVEIAEIKLEDGACQLLLIIFEKRPVLE